MDRYHSTNPSANNHHPNARPPITKLQYFLLLLAVSFIVAALFSLILMVVLRRPRLPNLQADSLNVSNFNLNVTSSKVTGNWDLQFSVQNPNKNIGIYYDKLEASIYYKSSFLSKTTMAPFNQGKKNKTVVGTWSFASEGNYVDGRVVEGINGDRKSGIVVFDVRISAMVVFNSPMWPTGTLVSGHSKCRVRM